MGNSQTIAQKEPFLSDKPLRQRGWRGSDSIAALLDNMPGEVFFAIPLTAEGFLPNLCHVIKFSLSVNILITGHIHRNFNTSRYISDDETSHSFASSSVMVKLSVPHEYSMEKSCVKAGSENNAPNINSKIFCFTLCILHCYLIRVINFILIYILIRVK